MQEYLNRFQRRIDDLTREVEGLGSLAEDLQPIIHEAKQTAHGQRPLPGLAQEGEEIAGVVGLEARIRELTAENERLNGQRDTLMGQFADARSEIVRLNEVCADTVAERDEENELAQNLLTALHLVTDASKLATAKSLARRAIDEHRQAREAANAKMHAAGPGQAAD